MRFTIFLTCVVLAIALATVVVLLNLIASWDEEDQAGNALYGAVPAARGENDLRIEGFISSDRIEPGKPVECWFIIQNMGDHPVTGVKLSKWAAAGFAPLVLRPREKPVLDVAAKDFFRIDGVLRAGPVPQRFRATAEFSWRDGNVQRAKGITLGPIAIRGATEPRVYAVSRRAVGLLKDLALPIVAVLLTYWFTTRQHESEFRQSAQNIMLTKSHENVECHYGPLAIASLNAGSRIKSLDASVSTAVHEALFYLLLFMKRSRVMYLKIGVYYLSSRKGEAIISRCADIVISRISQAIGLEARTAAVSKVKPTMEFWYFKKNVVMTAEVKVVEDLLRHWSKNEKEKLTFLAAVFRLYTVVLGNEMNVPYRFWYTNENLDPLPAMDEELAVIAAVDAALAKMYGEYVTFAGKAWKYDPPAGTARA
ncbi:MAG: hypothetical protein QOF63_626 [Thermoanaerobaculia bacterium]|jgi:hypothetical protein|nr:hypothetical protein [Thermoanaerobaculia bacterium]MEA2417124.1 hypothetical protein [Thermoanaerobaculia bacterium]